MSTLRILGAALVLSFSAQLTQPARASEPQPVVVPVMLKDLNEVLVLRPIPVLLGVLRF